MPGLTRLPLAADIECMWMVYMLSGLALYALTFWVIAAKDQLIWLVPAFIVGPLTLIPLVFVPAKPGSEWARRFGNEQAIVSSETDTPVAEGPTFTH